MESNEIIPYREGSLVYRMNSIAPMVRYGVGKIINIKNTPRNKIPMYEVDFINRGIHTLNHNEVMPVGYYFEHIISTTGGYQALFEIPGIVYEGDRFIKHPKNSFLYNKDGSVIIHFNKFSNFFKPIKDGILHAPTGENEFL